MATHCFNILTFNHPSDSLTFYFSDKEEEGTTRIFHELVPDEVIDKYGEQEHYYTSFCQEKEGFIPVTKPTIPTYEKITTEEGTEKSVQVSNSALSSSILKRYYNSLIHNHFKSKGCLVKPNFVSDTEVWLPSDTQDKEGIYKTFDRFSLKVQFRTVSNSLELLSSTQKLTSNISAVLSVSPIQENLTALNAFRKTKQKSWQVQF